MWPGFDSRTQRHMQVEFAASSLLRGFLFRVLPPQKLTLLNSNSIWNSGATVYQSQDCHVLPSLNKADLFNIQHLKHYKSSLPHCGSFLVYKTQDVTIEHCLQTYCFYCVPHSFVLLFSIVIGELCLVHQARAHTAEKTAD